MMPQIYYQLTCMYSLSLGSCQAHHCSQYDWQHSQYHQTNSSVAFYAQQLLPLHFHCEYPHESVWRTNMQTCTCELVAAMHRLTLIHWPWTGSFTLWEYLSMSSAWLHTRSAWFSQRVGSPPTAMYASPMVSTCNSNEMTKKGCFEST